ncbi:hypothetical protein QN277_007882 [Acacia crassicarpa]|uniref:Uncharacterized protein n=1 Tax=Acacia crassicarpa TaxID=499986 RepID=A0AAE1MFT9_9FABA|nr:hypothetical protein QN277_007882 [Acacia crassicarpa]
MLSQQQAIQTLEEQIGQIAALTKECPWPLRHSTTRAATKSDKQEAMSQPSSLFDDATADLLPATTSTLPPKMKGADTTELMAHNRATQLISSPQFQKFLELVQQSHVHMTPAATLNKMPTYVKFLKDTIPPRNKQLGFEIIPLTPAICDPGSQVNIMPRSVAEQITTGNEQTIEVSFQLVDRTMIHPTSERHNILMQVGTVTLPVDFIIHDQNDVHETPIILGRPFFALGQALMYVNEEELILNVNGKEANFSLSKAIRHSDDPDPYSALDEVDEIIHEAF